MKVALFGRNIKSAELPHLEAMLQIFKDKAIQCTVYEAFAEKLRQKKNLDLCCPTFSSPEQLLEGVDFMLSIGGDGTMLDTVAMVKDSGIPVLGINFGWMGFLAATSKLEIESAISALIAGTYTIVRRELIQVISNPPMFNGLNFGLNEFTIQRKNSSSMISITARLNGELLNTYWADGLIVATATGSTGYSLSCGGPIIYPESKCFVLTPVAPHNLNVRPLVIPNDCELSFEVQGRANKFLATIDTRIEAFDASYQFTIRKAPFAINMVSLDNKTFINALRSKLMWGQDQRN